jgi:hypothetical protein
MTTSDIFMVVFTGVIAITGVLGAIIFNGQLNVMQGQLDVTKRAFRQLEGPLISRGKISLTLQQRPQSADKPPVAYIWFKNDGRGPGTIFKLFGQFMILEGNIPPIPTYDSTKETDADLTIAAGQEAADPITFDLNLPQAKEGQMLTLTGSLFLYGYIKYRGAFDRGVNTYGFGFMPNHAASTFDVKGGTAYNYQKYNPEN